MINNILVTGANGQLGNEIRVLSQDKKTDSQFYFTSSKDLDISNFEAVEIFLITNSITHIINCAAYTAVDKAEKDEKNAIEINYFAVKNLAQISKKLDIKLIHISTDYVFDGNAFIPYKEDEITNPKSVYGKSKLDGENSIHDINPINSIIIRTSWVYSSFGNNFVKTMQRLGNEKDELGVIYDQVGTPTYARDLARAILEIVPKLNNRKVEIYHYSNEGVLSWYDFAKEIMKMEKLNCRINPIETKEYPTPAKRPHYSILNKSKIKKDFDIIIPYWKDSLKECLKELSGN